MTGEFEPNDSRNVTGTASTPDGHWTGQGGQTPAATGQQQQGGLNQSANPQSQNAPGSTGGMTEEGQQAQGGQQAQAGQQGGSANEMGQSAESGWPGQQDAGQGGGAGGQQNQLDSGSGQMGGSSGQPGMIGQVREHMTVVGPDGETCGRVDSVEGNQIKLTRNDSADGQHHYLDPGQIEAVEGDQIRLAQSPDWKNRESGAESGGESGGESSRAM